MPNWNFVESHKIHSYLSQDIISESHQQLFNEIKGFVSESKKSITNTIPTAIVSLGVNLPGNYYVHDGKCCPMMLICLSYRSLVILYPARINPEM